MTTNILLACFEKSPVIKKDIHTQLEETIAERKKLVEQWEILLLEKSPGVKQDIHVQLNETIARLKRERQVFRKSLSLEKQIFARHDKKAA